MRPQPMPSPVRVCSIELDGLFAYSDIERYAQSLVDGHKYLHASQFDTLVDIILFLRERRRSSSRTHGAPPRSEAGSHCGRKRPCVSGDNCLKRTDHGRLAASKRMPLTCAPGHHGLDNAVRPVPSNCCADSSFNSSSGLGSSSDGAQALQAVRYTPRPPRQK